MNRRNHLRTITLAVTLTVLALATGPGALGAGKAANSAGGTASVQPVDINRAGTEELTTIPGVGKTLAQRIVDFRDEHGPFKRVEDLLKVKGIGEKSLEKIRPYVKVASKG
jgi:competence protein ComEA